ncbi:dipeptide ABC transporter ATP-binding protein [Heyndrickxia oleronia]|jgi:peptide/nickel transport system ATP-binding protein|uniref:Peptide ABC transporter substrate-binding protein n=1 Tax=Heyndrickxia oleronia TaxID=38875 RepID=A0A8E2LD22_9BACI|nr:dipeptide ABC transporter ATP-binding protein [Heyndrickxia oleronia]OJH17647.1 peptide ABC transporter substrate-binding protein [Bacillus obstructivus]MEC1373880.1 dipeptide ABC transporter ATP-binding protein [Heyndrickxia oleronia]OOP67600.1 peptide ABC transporter substrate-binding protein [Heyndrickxia oleronia]QQZ03511.1 dipeptide ABC transporter ATP-binding protein [Heyndrickxia oleronia]GIN37905.1 dipeptide ABC transporter ATP-binding protein [Heyndrickxia oleronia]
MSNTATKNKEKLLEIQNLKTYYPVKGGFLRRTIAEVKAVDDVSFVINKGETLGLVGESGCGKSTAGRTILKLLNPTSGKIIFDGKDITNLGGKELRLARKDFQMVFQDPYASLNPKQMVGDIVSEPIRNFTSKSMKDLKLEVLELLQKVGLPEDAYYKYPHEFSGGQRQRIGIARALALKPKLIVADEPVSALDVSVQSQVLNLLKELQNEFDLTYLFIAHDLSVVKHMSDRIGVMYLGNLVEIADKSSLYAEPLHPYTQALISAIPEADPRKRKERIILQGDVPSPVNPPSGCPFHTRCPVARDECSKRKPSLKEVKPGHQVACVLYE